MNPQTIAAVRWFLLALAVLSFLQATVLHRVFERYLLQPWIRLNEGHGGAVPRFMREPRFLRGWSLLMMAVFVLLWWVSGTTTGRDWLSHARH